jgi:hypothetical protein
MQRGYRCVLTEPTGERFDPCFVPDLTINSRTAQVARRPATPSEVKFAADSLLEESGFELPVPLLRKRVPGVAEGRCWTDRLGGAPPNRGLARCLDYQR